MARKDILFPVGRLVEGSLTKGQDKNMDGGPLVTKSGPNAGQPRLDYFFAVAIPKGVETSWSQTAWGADIYRAGQEAFPNQIGLPTFAWKVRDGDSHVPNAKGKIPAEKEGYPGNWIVYFSSGFAPKCFNANGSAPVDAETIKCGHYVQVFANVDGNGSNTKPGVFLNHQMVAHAGFGPEIYQGPDPGTVGFGTGAAPAGMSATPVAGIATAANVPGAPAQAHTMTGKAPGVTYEAFKAQGWTDDALIAGGYMLPSPAVQHAPPAPAPAAPAAPAPPMPAVPAPVPTVPNPGVLAPPAPAAGPRKLMTPKAAGVSYEAMLANGWTDDLMVRDGYMTIG